MALPKTKEVPLPIEYRDGSAVYFYFSVPTKLAAEVMGNKYEPATVAFGHALAALCFFEYRDTSIGPYNELGLGLMVKGAPGAGWLGLDQMKAVENRKTGFHILSLPVTSDTACQAGREIWGLPKFVTEIPFSLKDRHFVSSVTDPKNKKQALFVVESELGRGMSSKGLDLALFNHRENGREKAVVNCQSRFTTARPSDFTLTINRGDHPLQALLRVLELDGASPWVVQYTTRFVSQLHGPVGI